MAQPRHSGLMLVERVVVATEGRDRVLDSVKAGALVLVVVGHSLAWHVTPTGTATNILEVAPAMSVLTWLFQILPLFFAAGAVSNAASFRRHGTDGFLRIRTLRLTTPVVMYTLVWTVVLLPIVGWAAIALGVGQFLAQLLWFAGVYLIVVAAVPLTVRWTSRPFVTIGLWAIVVVIIDVQRVAGGPTAISWLNLILVWGLLHQIGYYLPRLRDTARPVLVAGAAVAFASAVAMAIVGRYSRSLISVGADPRLSHLAPQSIVLLLYGSAQILLLAALWPALRRLLTRDRLWTAVAVVGARGMGIYLWHIPLVTLAVGLTLVSGLRPDPLSPTWWVLHVAVVIVVLPGAWWLAGVAGRGEALLRRVPRLIAMPAVFVAVAAGVMILNISVTGFATWWGMGMLGFPASAVLNLLILMALWQSALGAGPAPPHRPPLR